MKRICFATLLILFSALVSAQTIPSASMTSGANLLFKGVTTKLSPAEKNAIFQKIGLKLSADKKSLVMDEAPAAVQVFPTDLNKDGAEDVFVTISCVQLYGDQDGLMLFMKPAGGAYKAYPDFGSGRPMVLPTSSKGYPDLVIAGPGFSFPAFRWNGTRYENWRSVKDSELGNAVDIGAYSKKYTTGR